MVVDMAAIPDPAGEGLGHVGGDSADLVGELARHHLEERVAVSRCQSVRVCEIDLILAIAVFVLSLVRLPAQTAHRIHHPAKVADSDRSPL